MAIAPVNNILSKLAGVAQIGSNFGLDSLKRAVSLLEIDKSKLGLLYKSSNLMTNTLLRNMGNGLFLSSEYNGTSMHGTNIGETANIYANTVGRTAWFMSDTDKNNYSNYLDFMNGVYGNNGASWTRWLGTAATIASMADQANDYFGGLDISKEVAVGQAAVQTVGSLINGIGSLFKKKKGEGEDVYANTDDTFWSAYTHPQYSPVGINRSFNFGSGKIVNPNSEKRDTKLGKIAAERLNNIMQANIFLPTQKNSFDKSDYIATVSGGKYKYKEMENTTAEFLREEYSDIGNTTFDNYWVITYAEAENTPKTSPFTGAFSAFNKGSVLGDYTNFKGEKAIKDLLQYTNQRFLNLDYGTLIGRFHTPSSAFSHTDTTQTSGSRFGLSHGRNLIKRSPSDNINGYDDPYCRVWTFHKQYQQYTDTIRPFNDEGIDELRTQLQKIHPNTLKKNDELIDKLNIWSNKSHLVRYAPDSNSYINTITRCMFSIENLAWKHTAVSEDKQFEMGPNGGRIMWFPPYDLKFSENVSAPWNSTSFIGRGEKIYTYTDTERSGNLSFKILIDHPLILDKWTETGQNGNGDNGYPSINENGLLDTEETLLRFFAGCEVLKPTIPEPEPDEPSDDGGNNTIEENDGNPDFVFFVYFPNNYSGYMEKSSSSDSDAIDYLCRGCGVDVPTDKKLTYGYEMTDNSVSQVVERESPDYNKIVTSVTVVPPYSSSSMVVFKPIVYSLNSGRVHYWWYRCDYTLQKEIFKINPNYCDTKSFKLNSSGYKKAFEESAFTIGQEFGDRDAQDRSAGNPQDRTKAVSFADFIKAFDDNGNRLSSGTTTSEENVEILQSIDKSKVKKIKCDGYASQDGTDKNNEGLAIHRAKTVANYVKTFFSECETECTGNGDDQSKDSKTGDASDLISKLWRCAKVSIYLSKEDVEQANNGGESDTEPSQEEEVNFVELPDRETLNEEQTVPEYREIRENWVDPTPTFYEETPVEESNDMPVNDGDETNVIQEVVIKPRLTTEYDYFAKLEKTDPFVFRRLTDQVKYFNPAFHSITPEGFNARLTFLHQCTRQGNTMGVLSGDKFASADNLSFGAPPVCVLKIGDFYNTRIIIDSLNIDYGDNQWDMNDEGIGVMPMMADVRIGFKFIGGSDIEGPIRRLQNALSFNYYANTRIYEDRAESATELNNNNVEETE